MTCSSCQQGIEKALKKVEGVTSVSVSLLTQQASIQYMPSKVGIRQMIEEVEDIGFRASYEAKSEKSDIRAIVNQEMKSHRRKMIISVALQIPIMLLMWVIAFTSPEFLTAHNRLNGVPLFVYLVALFATII
mmetsp:Transcript_7664/g.7061  ORF Transcript_7664/g.7061 Transcript_7664/m.7061 type:complete len:132 (+) Transcript_7664:495-890(+)